MKRFAIIEIDAGLTVVEVPPGETPESVASRNSGAYVNVGVFDTYEDALDAMAAMPAVEEENLPPE